MNFFFAILSKLKNKGTREIVLGKEELKELVSYDDRNAGRFIDVMENLGKKIQHIYYIERSSNSFEIMNLFQKFKASWNDDLTDMTVQVKVSEEYEYIMNRLNIQFTNFKLLEFTYIRSTYAKTMYRLLKQWRTVGRRRFKIDEFKMLLDIAKSYRASDIDKRVIAPIMDELSEYFENLHIEKEKSNSRGTPVIAYIFTWEPEKTTPYDPNKYTKKKSVGSRKKTIRKETMPDWENDNEEEDHVDPETEKFFRERLKRMREDKE